MFISTNVTFLGYLQFNCPDVWVPVPCPWSQSLCVFFPADQVFLFAPPQAHDIPAIQVIKPLINWQFALESPMLSTSEYSRSLQKLLTASRLSVVILTQDIACNIPPCEPASLHYQKNSSQESHNAVARPAHVAISHLKQAAKRQGKLSNKYRKKVDYLHRVVGRIFSHKEFHW